MEPAARVGVALRMRALPLVLCLCACGAPAPPIVAAPSAQEAPAPEPAEPRRELEPSALLARSEPMWWLVRDRDGAPACRPFVPEAFTTEGEGRLRPRDPEARTTPVVVSIDGVPQPPPPPPDPWRRVDFGYRVRDGAITLHAVRTRLAVQTVLVSGCERTLALAAAPWFATEASCDAARTSRAPLELGECADALAAVVADDFGSAGLERVATRGGTVHALERIDGAPACIAWRVTPPRRGAREGTMRASELDGAATVETSFAYSLDGAVLTLLGPSVRTTERGRVTSETSFGCGESYLVRQSDDLYALVGGVRWYFDRAACESASVQGGAAKRGGC